MSTVRAGESDQNCAEFQQRLPQLFESETDFSKEKHLESCENCAELVRDLRYIAQQAKLLMPIHDPAPAVWENIRTAIQSNEESGKVR
jgi:predicted anti-sigma-YlaC factor YlaD